MNIAYYNSESFLITQLSPVIDQTTSDPYILLDEQDQLLLEKNKFIPQRFTVNVIDQAQHLGKLVEVYKNSPVKLAKIEKFFLVPYDLPAADIIFRQNISNKTIEISVAHNDFKYEMLSQPFLIAACIHNNPYHPLWTQNIDLKSLLTKPSIIQYTSHDNFRLYVLKTFISYSHELQN